MIKCFFKLDVDWILYSLSYSYIEVIYCFITSTSPDISAEAIQDADLLHTYLNTFCSSIEISFEKGKREMQMIGFYIVLSYSYIEVLQQSCSSAADLSRRYCSKLSFRLFFLRYYTCYCSISTILKGMALEQDTSSRSENVYVSCRKRG